MIGLLTALGVFVLIPSAILIKDAISSITADALSRAFGLFILEFALVFAAVGAACLAIVWLLFLGDKVGRMLAVILCASIALAELLNSTRTGWDTTALVVSIGCVLALVALPDSRAFFSSDDPRPVGVVVTTALLAVLAWSWALAGIMLLPLGRYEGKDVAYGILFLAGAVVATIVNRQLRLGNQTARIVASVVLVAVSVVDLLVEHTAAGAVVMVGLAAGAIGTLWIPESSRNFFARPGAGLPAGFVWPWHVRTGARGFEATGPGLTRFRAAALQTQRRPVGGPAAYGLVGGVLLLAVVLSIWSYASAGSALALGNSGSFGSQDYATTTIPSYGTTTTLPTVSEEVTHTWTITEADPNGNTFTVTLAVGQPEPYNTSNPPNAAQIDGGGGAITAGQGCSLSQGSDAVVPALITANNPNPSNTMNEG
ncbi:MAG TPA: hypothetical protein VE991_03260, partial [Acidimicrobiales bacterium]|nr:hypothetical protein [Acidimicrobiales bacterium]